MFTVVVRFLGLTLIKFEINLILLIKPYLYTAKKSRRKDKYFENE